MTVRLALADTEWPLFRIYVMPPGHWSDRAQSASGAGQPWLALPMAPRVLPADPTHNMAGAQHGFTVQNITRDSLPNIGEAVFQYHYGKINDRDYGIDSDGGARDLIGWDVRICISNAIQDDNGDLSWTTVFLGTVQYQEDAPFASTVAAGTRTYMCADLLWRTKRWMLNRSSTYVDGAIYDHGFGHPGYNHAVSGFYHRLIGNKEATGATVDPFGDLYDNPSGVSNGYAYHTWPGSDPSVGIPWTDRAALLHALHSSRAKGEPMLDVIDASGLLAESFAWPVNDGDECFSFINRILRRQRGRGLARLSWADDTFTGTPSQIASIYPYIEVTPQIATARSYTKPAAGGSATIPAATVTKAVDLIGDHRLVDGSIKIGKKDTQTIEYLESVGEAIEVVCTLSPGEASLEGRWSAADLTTFKSLANFYQKSYERWRPICQRYALPNTWDFKVKDGNGGTAHRIDFRCKDDGTIEVPTTIATDSPMLVRINGDLPLYEGYNYAVNPPVRYDAATDYISPPRRGPIILAKNGTDVFNDLAADYGFGLSIDEYGLYIASGSDQANGTRTVGDKSGSIGSAFNTADLVVTVSLSLPTRVKMATASTPTTGPAFTQTTSGRRLTVYHSGICLWLCDSKAIWELDRRTTLSANSPPKRNAVPGSASEYGILRDDRDYLAWLHNLTWAWYSAPRAVAQWTIRDCGFLQSFETLSADGNPQSTTYAKLGTMVTTLDAGGITYNVNAPCTRISYDNTNGTTTWFCDWCDLDYQQ